jgi:hypothetical protein
MDPFTMILAATGAVAPEVIRLIQGNKMRKTGEAIAKQYTRPELGVNPEEQEALDIARQYSTSRDVPGFNTAKEGLEGSFANAITGANKTGTPDLNTLYKTKADALLGLTDRATQFNQNNINTLLTQLMKMSQKKDAMFDYNKSQPYYEAMESARRLSEAGMQNNFAALSNIGGAATDTASLLLMEKLLSA